MFPFAWLTACISLRYGEAFERGLKTPVEEECASEVPKMSSRDIADYGDEEDVVEEKKAEEAPEAEKKAEAAPEEKKGGEGGEEEKKAEEVQGNVIIKKSLCRYWQAGHCDRGQWCGWAHGPEEIGKTGLDPQGLKTSLCKYYMAGTCPKTTEECVFAHGEQELGKKKPAVPRKGGRGGKDRKGKAGGKGGKGGKKAYLVPQHETSRARRSDSKGSRARRSDSRSQALIIIIQTRSLFFPLHQDKTSSASTLYN